MDVSEKLCIFCQHFKWSGEEFIGMGSTQTGPMFGGGGAVCSAGHYGTNWKNRLPTPADEEDYRAIILRGQNCPDYEQVKT